jgi:chemotaxis response regulator CheB
MGIALVIVNRLRAVATQLHKILQQFKDISVELITERLGIEPNHVFVIPENRAWHVLAIGSAFIKTLKIDVEG